MEKQVIIYYCDRCGEQLTEREHNSEKLYVDKISSAVRHLCSKCYAEFEPKQKELLSWLEMDGCAAIYNARFLKCPQQED